jgi:hypothetical protein
MGLKFKPAGFTIQAIPARDLTDEEVEQWGEDYLIATGLYVREDIEPTPEAKPKRKRKGTNREGLAKEG